MIELNLTYEESKKILELGYDFRSVCTKFECREMVMNNEEATTLTFLYSCGEIMTMWNPRMSEPYSYHLKSSPASGITPIIPKAALEACLPILRDSYYLSKQHVSQDKIIPRDNNERWVNYPHSEMTAYTAFLWVHENYPEELKEKFDEVMG